MYATALMMLDTMEMVGMSECSENSEVTYAERFQVMDPWNALTAYVSQKLG
jgi:hypothetical protein